MTLPQKLAALSQVVSDAMAEALGDFMPSAASALITTLNRGPLIIGEIAETVGLTHSATVRVIDRLEKDGLVRRRQRLGRTVLVEATARGRKRALELIAAREKAAAAFLEGLDDDDGQALLAILGKIIDRQFESALSSRRLCRFCRLETCDCSAGEGDAPSENAAVGDAATPAERIEAAGGWSPQAADDAQALK